MEKRDELRIRHYLTKMGFEVRKQSPQLYGASGEPDIIAKKGRTWLAIEVKDFKTGGKVKKQQIYMLNKYKRDGYYVFLLDSEEKFTKFKNDLETYLKTHPL